MLVKLSIKSGITQENIATKISDIISIDSNKDTTLIFLLVAPKSFLSNADIGTFNTKARTNPVHKGVNNLNILPIAFVISPNLNKQSASKIVYVIKPIIFL